MITLTGSIIGLDAVLSDLNGLEDRVVDAVESGVARGALQGQSIVRGNARGRPGPRAVTGDFNRSIVGDHERAGSVVFAQIGTNAAQGARLEFGFFGPDALQRVYMQPPYPYLGPSVPDVTDAFVSQITDALGRVL